MDKRRNPRYSIDLEAVAFTSADGFWVCRVHDFCQEGMLLVDKTGESLPSLKQLPGADDSIQIHLCVPDEKGLSYFTVDGKVVRFLASGMGINFPDGMQRDLLKTLLVHSENQSPVVTPVTEEGVAALNRLDLGLTRYGGRSLNPLLKLERSALVKSGVVRANSLELLVGDLRRLVKKSLPQLMGRFLDHLEEELTRALKHNASEVEKSDLLDTLSKLQKRSQEIRRIFHKDVLNKIDNPRELQGLIAEYRRQSNHTQSRRVMAPGQVLSSVGEFQDWLSLASVIDHGQSIYEDYLGDIQARLGQLVESWGYNEGNPMGVYVFCHAFTHAISYLEPSARAKELIHSGLRSQLLPGLRKLYIQGNQVLEESGCFADQADKERVPESLHTRVAMEESVTDLASEDGFTRHEYDEWGIPIDELVSGLQQDFRLTETCVSNMSRLAAVWKEIVQTSAVGNRRTDRLYPLESANSYLVDVLDQLTDLDVKKDDALNTRLSQIIDSGLEEKDAGMQLFASLSSRLAPLVEGEKRQFITRFQRTVRASEEQEAVLASQYSLVQVLERSFSGKPLPKLFIDLLVPSWRNLLLNSYLRHGGVSAEWNRYMRTLHQVYAHLNPDQDPSLSTGYMTPHELVAEVQEGLESIACDSARKAPILKALHQLVSSVPGDGSYLRTLPRINLQPGEMASVLGLDDAQNLAEEKAMLADEAVYSAEMASWIQSVSALIPGERLINRKEEEKGDLILSWSNEDKSRMVFVDDRGLKSAEYSLLDLAANLNDGNIIARDQSESSPSIAVFSRMMAERFRHFYHDVNHEKNTGLLNRRWLEKHLPHIYLESQRDDSAVLMALVGYHQSATTPLNFLANEFSDLEESEDIRLSAYDDGRLCIILPADQQMQLLNKVESQPGVQLGGLLVDRLVDSGKTLFQGLESTWDKVSSNTDDDSSRLLIEHNYTGRNLVGEDVHWWGNLRSREDLISRMDDGWLSLHCQKVIQFQEDTSSVHGYEILLQVSGDGSGPNDTSSFILAADALNAMDSVDRWVVSKGFNWIANNSDSLDPRSLFSINLSASSVKDPGFLEFVLQQLHESTVDPGKIAFEVKERVAINHQSELLTLMEVLTALGVRFFVDDCGNHAEGLIWLDRLPVFCAKVDGDYIRNLADRSSEWHLVNQINEACHRQGVKTLAMHVESEEVLSLLVPAGFDYAQGFGAGRKVPLESLILQKA